MPKLRRPTGMTVLLSLSVAMIFYLLLVPLIVQTISAFRGPFLPFGVPTAQWGLDNFRTLYGTEGDLWATLRATALFVGGASVVSLGVGFCLAWLVVRTNLRGRKVVSVLVVLPFLIPGIVMAQSYYLMLSPESGVLNQALRLLPFFDGDSGPINPFAFPSVVVIQGLAWVAFPFMLFVPILKNMDASLEEAARASGASWPATLRRVTLPVLWPGLLGVITLQAILMLGSLEVPLIFGQQSGQDIFALRMWSLITSNPGELPQYGLAAVYGLHFFALTSVLFVFYMRANRRADERASVSGKAFRPITLPMGRWSTPVWAVLAPLLLVMSVLPVLSMIWGSVTPYPIPFSVDNLMHDTSLGAFGSVLQDPEFWASAGRTFIIAAGSATLAVTVAAVSAYAAARGRRKRRMRALDLIASSSVAIPGVIAGFASFLLYLVLNRYIPLSGTIIALILAYSYRLSIAYRANFSATLQIKPELEEAAAASGASRVTTFRRIVLPLLAPAFAAVWIQLFIIGTTEFTLAAFLATPESRPLSMYVYSRISPRAAQLYAPDQGAAMALIFTVLVLLIAYFSTKVAKFAAASQRGGGKSDGGGATGITSGGAPVPTPSARATEPVAPARR